MLRLKRVDVNGIIKEPIENYIAALRNEKPNLNLLHDNSLILIDNAKLFMSEALGKKVNPTLFYVKVSETIFLLSVMAQHSDTTIIDVLNVNMEKLTERKKTNTLRGNGETVNERKAKNNVAKTKQTSTRKKPVRKKSNIQKRKRVR
jgi:hypothetical protein